jgi:hypothetical protein
VGLMHGGNPNPSARRIPVTELPDELRLPERRSTGLVGSAGGIGKVT